MCEKILEGISIENRLFTKMPETGLTRLIWGFDAAHAICLRGNSLLLLSLLSKLLYNESGTARVMSTATARPIVLFCHVFICTFANLKQLFEYLIR